MPPPVSPEDAVAGAEIHVAWPNVVRFTRQLSHDLRNTLNAIELQAAYLAEIVENADAREEIGRLRKMAAELGSTLHSVTSKMMPVRAQLMPYSAADLLDDLRQKIASTFAEQHQRIRWSGEVADRLINIDPQLLQQAFVELFANAFHHDSGAGDIEVRGSADGKEFRIEIREPKTQFNASTANWGRQPLQTTRQGHYGLGLCRVRAILEAQQGAFKAEYDPAASALITTVALPLVGAQ